MPTTIDRRQDAPEPTAPNRESKTGPRTDAPSGIGGPHFAEPAPAGERIDTPPAHRGGGLGTSLWAVLRLVRPRQWSKNALCMAGVIFSGQAFNPGAILLGLLTVLVFSFGASSVYVLNDIVDRRRDREHPKKRRRPIASGSVSVAGAAVIGACLMLGGLGGAWLLHPATFVCLSLYLLNNMAYSSYLKHLALMDVVSIATGFVLRLLAGVYVLSTAPTAWITLCTFFLALFLAIAKRRAELHSIGRTTEQTWSPDRRPVLSKYSVEYLDNLLSNSATMTIMFYALFTVAADKNSSLILTLPIVYYAIMHYKRRVMIQSAGEEPERVLLADLRFPFCVAAWLVLYVLIEYTGIRLFV